MGASEKCSRHADFLIVRPVSAMCPKCSHKVEIFTDELEKPKTCPACGREVVFSSESKLPAKE